MARKNMQLDPVTFEVLKNSFVNLVDQMAEVVFKTCHSFAIWVGDFSSCLCNSDGDIVAQGSRDISVHVGTLGFTVKSCIKVIGKENLHPGDAILFNDPYTGGTHFNDVRLVRPIFYEDELIAFTVVCGHWSDVGGTVPGSFDIRAREHYGEGFRITPVKIMEKGKFNEPLVQMVTSNMRVHEERFGDLRSMAEATRIAGDRLLGLVNKYGIRTVLKASEELLDYTERMLRSELKKLPKISYEWTDYIDQDPLREEGLIPIHTRISIKGDEVEYDFTGSSEPIGCFLNSCFGPSHSAILSSIKNFFPHIPLNSGLYRVIKTNLPANSVVNAPEPVAATGYCSGAYEKIMNSGFAIWSRLKPKRAMGCSFNIEYLLMGGIDKRKGYNRSYIYYDWLPGGWGGRNGRDGPSPIMPAFGVGLMNQPVEATERLCPIIVESYNIVTDSAGPGKWRGGPGVERQYQIYASEKLVLSYCCDRERYPPFGLNGGLLAYPHGALVNPNHPLHERYLGAIFSAEPLKDGDVVWRVSSGGGGFGDPLEREPKSVLEDVIDEYVSIEGARRDYGVVIREIDKRLLKYEIDMEATMRERARMREERVQKLDTEPEDVQKLVLECKISYLEAIRHYGVVLDRSDKKLCVLPNTTRTLKEEIKCNVVPYWK